MNTTFRAHQIVRLHEFTSTDLHLTISARAVASAFNVSHLALTRAKLRGYEDPPARRRHHEFSADRQAEIVEWLAEKAANNTAVNRTELLNKCIERFGKSIT
jgi:transposase